jgi:hypothetical protein
MTLNMVDVVNGNQVFLENLMIYFRHALGNQAKVVVESQNGLHNPIGPNLVFLPIEDGQEFNLKRHLDILTRGHKPIAKK